MSRLRPDSTAFTLLLGALVTLASFSIDMGLPVLAATAADLRVAPATAALTLSVFMAGYALGPLVVGPLSDRYGRRTMLLVGCAIFTAFGTLGAFAGSFGALLAWRFCMGVGAGAGPVLAMAMIRDLFRDGEARARQSYVNLAAGVAPIVAPSLGVAVAAVGGWRGIYGVLAAGGVALLAAVALRLGESAPALGAHPLTLRGVLGSYARVVRHRVSFGYALVLALSFGALFAYVSASSLVLIGLLGVSARAYAYLFASTASGLMAGAFLNARLSRRGVPHPRLIVVGLGAAAVTAVALLLLTGAGRLSVWSLIPLLIVGNVGTGMARPNAAQGALEPLPEIAGVAAALLGGLQTLGGALASAVVAALFDGRTAIAMTGTMAVCSVGALAVYLGVVRRAERRGRVSAEAGLAAA